MGSATRQSLTTSRAALTALGAAVDLACAEELFAAARAIGSSLQLRAMLSDAATEASEKKAVIDAVFAKSLGATALTLLTVAASDRWSSDDDLLGGISTRRLIQVSIG